MPYLASGYSSVTAAASRCAVECRRMCSGSSVASWSPYSLSLEGRGSGRGVGVGRGESAMRPSVYWRLDDWPFPASLHAAPSHPGLWPIPRLRRGGPSGTRGGDFMNPSAIVDALGYPAAGLGILIESA